MLRARLADAKFFFDQDRKTTLADRVEQLETVVYHNKLGSQFERMERVEALAGAHRGDDRRRRRRREARGAGSRRPTS